MKKITSFSKLIAWFVVGVMLAISLNTALAQMVPVVETELSDTGVGVTARISTPTGEALGEDPDEQPGAWEKETELDKVLLGVGDVGVEATHHGVGISDKGQIYINSESGAVGLGVASDNIAAYVSNTGAAAQDAGTLIESTEVDGIGLYTEGKVGLKAGEMENTASIMAEGKNYGVYGKGNKAGLYAEATNTDPGVAGVYARSDEAVGTAGLIGKSTTADGKGLIGLFEPEGIEGRLGWRQYGLYTDEQAEFRDLDSEGFEVQSGNLTVGTEATVGILASPGALQTNALALLTGDTTITLEDVAFSGLFKIENDVYLDSSFTPRLLFQTSSMMEVRDSVEFEDAASKIAVDGSLVVEPSLTVEDGDLHADGVVTSATGIGHFTTCENDSPTEVSVSCSCAVGDAVLIGCGAQADAGNEGIQKIFPTGADHMCHARASQPGHRITVTAYCFVPNI